MGALRDWRHEKFAADYVERGLKGERTARDSAFAAAGCAASKANAGRLKNRPEVKARVQEPFDRAAEFADVNRPRIVVELDRVGRGDVANFVESVPTASGGFELRLKDITKPPPAATRRR